MNRFTTIAAGLAIGGAFCAAAAPAHAGITCNLTDQKGNSLVYSFTRGGHGYTNEVRVARNNQVISNGGPMWTRTWDKPARKLVLQQDGWSIVYDSDTGIDHANLYHGNYLAATGVCDPDYSVDRPLPQAPTIEASGPPPAPEPSYSSGGVDAVPVVYQGRSVHLVAKLGDQYVNMLLDTGATDVSVNRSVAEQLVASGHATWGPTEQSTLAGGLTTDTPTILIDSVQVGSHVIANVRAGVDPDGSMSLLGMSVLRRINSGKFTIDTANNVLVFG
jgi:clan AA aspartic protease (TIGR02281 family)